MLAGGAGRPARAVRRIGRADRHHLALWHDPGLPLGLSAVALAAGGLLVVARAHLGVVLDRLRAPFDGDTAYRCLARRLTDSPSR